MLMQTQLIWFLNSFLEDYSFGNLCSFFYFWDSMNKLEENFVITFKNCNKELETDLNTFGKGAFTNYVCT